MNSSVITMRERFKLAQKAINQGATITLACKSNSLSRPTYYKYKLLSSNLGCGMPSPISRAPKVPRKHNVQLANKIKIIVHKDPGATWIDISKSLEMYGYPAKSRSTIVWYLRKLNLAGKLERYKSLAALYKDREYKLTKSQIDFLTRYNYSYGDLKVLSRQSGASLQTGVLEIKSKQEKKLYTYVCIEARSGFVKARMHNVKNSAFILPVISEILPNIKLVEVSQVSFHSRYQLNEASQAVYTQRVSQCFSEKGATPEISFTNGKLKLGMLSRFESWLKDELTFNNDLDERVQDWNNRKLDYYPNYSSSPLELLSRETHFENSS